MEVVKPGATTKEDFANFSRTGGLLNAYESIKIAATLKGERKVLSNPAPQPKPKVNKSKKG